MRKPGQLGRQVITSLVTVTRRLEGHTGYAAAQVVAERLTQVPTREWGELSITVNVIEATWVEMDSWRGVPVPTIVWFNQSGAGPLALAWASRGCSTF